MIKNIIVGKNPCFIERFGDVYVVNSDSNSVSVIKEDNNTVIDNIPVEKSPSFLGTFDKFGPVRAAIYVANSGSNTISVIDPYTKKVIKSITVGENPRFIETFGDSIYVANSGSNTVSLVDLLTNEEVAGMKFDIKPLGGGQITCDELDTPINRFLYVSSGAKCIAKPNIGFGFSSWTQNLPQNTNITINATTSANSPLAAIRNAISGDPAATLTVNRFGNFTAYFRVLPPPVPAEFTASIITVIVAAFVGSLLIPATVNWLKSKKQTSRRNSFHLDMDSINKDGLDEPDIKNLNELNQRISNPYAAGKITNEQYTNLKNEISAAYQKIFKKRIESITYLNTEAVNNIRTDIEDAYSDRKITELDYNLLNGKISRMLKSK